MSKVCSATSRASSVPRKSGYSFFSTYAHVGWGTTTSRPARTAGASTATLLSRVLLELRRRRRRRATASRSTPGPRGARTRCRCARRRRPSPCRSSGSWYSTRHVGKSATVAARGSPAATRRSRAAGTTSRSAPCANVGQQPVLRDARWSSPSRRARSRRRSIGSRSARAWWRPCPADRCGRAAWRCARPCPRAPRSRATAASGAGSRRPTPARCSGVYGQTT